MQIFAEKLSFQILQPDGLQSTSNMLDFENRDTDCNVILVALYRITSLLIPGCFKTIFFCTAWFRDSDLWS